MPEKRTLQRARRDARQGKAASTQAGEFVREEIHHIRQGKLGAASAKRAIAIGLSKARRAGVKLKPPARGRVSEKTRRSAASAYRKGQRGEKVSARRSRARLKALRKEGRGAASHRALSRQTRGATRRSARYHHMAVEKQPAPVLKEGGGIKAAAAAAALGANYSCGFSLCHPVLCS
jgi:hypothetical protein